MAEILKITSGGFDQLISRARKEIDKGNNLQPLMTEISGIMADAVEQNFADQGRPQWDDLAPSTKKNRARRGKWPGQILQDSGQLAASVQPGASATSAWVGTNKAYAAIQQLGGEITRKPYSTTVRLRTDARGELMRQGKNGNLSIFAAKRHKRATERFRFTMGHSFKIPARPFLKLTPADGQKIEAAGQRFFTPEG